MSFLDRLFGRRPDAAPARRVDPDAVAVERYRYLLRTAPPDQLEQAHLEAFEQLTPEQRSMVRADLAAASPADAPASDDPRDLARAATRAEVREPGTLERTFQGQGAMSGMGGSFMGTFATMFIATSAANMLFGSFGSGDPGTGDPGTGDPGTGDPGTGDPGTADGQGGTGADTGGDAGGMGDFGGGDFGDF